MSEHVQRPPAEIRYAGELARLRENDTGDRPPGWALSLLAARRFILGDDEPGIGRKFVGDPSLIDRSRAGSPGLNRTIDHLHALTVRELRHVRLTRRSRDFRHNFRMTTIVRQSPRRRSSSGIGEERVRRWSRQAGPGGERPGPRTRRSYQSG